jgi:hypothetical protein
MLVAFLVLAYSETIFAEFHIVDTTISGKIKLSFKNSKLDGKYNNSKNKGSLKFEEFIYELAPTIAIEALIPALFKSLHNETTVCIPPIP